MEDAASQPSFSKGRIHLSTLELLISYHLLSSLLTEQVGKAWLSQPPKVHFPHTFDSPTFCPKWLLSFGGKRLEESGKCLGLRSNYMGNKSNYMCLHPPGDRAGPRPSERLFCGPRSSRPCRSWCRIKIIGVPLQSCTGVSNWAEKVRLLLAGESIEAVSLVTTILVH